MSESKPQMAPAGSEKSISGGDISKPSQFPPLSMAENEYTESHAPLMAGMGDAAPSLPLSTGISADVGAWQQNKRINGLWGINQNRNSWMGVTGIGWKKLANNSDSAIVALTMLAAHAREKNSTVNYREESDGMIYEMYVY
ncbi:MAG: hypothetical protein QUT30_05825 [Acidobacteriota bacterium]|nr:hypothetical protein [Acidobacteriota bacterium]